MLQASEAERASHLSMEVSALMIGAVYRDTGLRPVPAIVEDQRVSICRATMHGPEARVTIELQDRAGVSPLIAPQGDRMRCDAILSN
jgi:hypothetical protein